MTWCRLILGVVAASMGTIAGFLIINTVRPNGMFSPSKLPSPYLHPIERTGK
jgi:hypothetical protein